MTGKVVKWPLCWGVVLLATVLLAACGSGDAQNAKQGHKKKSAQPAQVLTMKAQPLTLNKSYPALLRSPQEVDVVARVSGFLRKRRYNEGAKVKKGQQLFTIEPEQYKAQVEQKKANLASAKASEHNAARSWKRIRTLYKGKNVSEERRDNARAKLETTRASVKQTKAALDQAQIDLGYTEVRAPVTGMISLSKVNEGNLVQPSEKLATITPLHPIEARFSMPEQEAAALRMQRRNRGDAPTVSAAMTTANGKTITGKVDFLGSQVDQQTGTVQARATFENKQALFLPGQFANVKLRHLRLPHVFAVPQPAVAEGQEGAQLYVLNKKNKVQPNNVDLGAQTANHWIIVTSGIDNGDRVVVNHLSSIKPGTKVKPQKFQGKRADASASGKPANNHGGKDNKSKPEPG